MSTRSQPPITRDPELHSGSAVFTGTRVAVKVLLDHLADGRLDDLLVHYPLVTREQAVAALREVEHLPEATA